MADPTTSHLVTAGQAVVDVLLAQGTTHVYGMPGGHVLGILDAITTSEGIESILVRHEHSAAAMAAAHAQLTGEPGVVLVTAGPGVTNTLTAVAEAYVGALPLVVLSGRGATATVMRGASQELPTHLMFAEACKWTVRVDRADLLAEAVHRAFVVARSGKPGPVLVDIPRDLLAQQVPARTWPTAGVRQRVTPDPSVVTQVSDALAGADRPLVIAGGGVLASEAADRVRRLAELLGAPILTSLAGRGSLPDEHALAAGGLGAHKNMVSKRLLHEADVVLGLGTRFEEMETNWQPAAMPRPEATYIQVDLDPEELGRSIPAAIPVLGDIRATLDAVLDRLDGDERVEAARTARERDELPRLREEVAALRRSVADLAASEERPVSPVRVIREAREVFPANTVLGVDVGALSQHIGGAFPFFDVHEPRSTIVPSSFYGMGFVSAAMPAAKIVHPDRPALCFVGDGSFQMHMNIVPVAAQYRLGVTWVVLNDEALGSIWDIQHYLFEDRTTDTEFVFQPDFAQLAAACGAHGERVEDPLEVRAALVRALKANQDGQPAVVDVRVARTRLMQTREHYNTTFPQDVDESTTDQKEAHA